MSKWGKEEEILYIPSIEVKREIEAKVTAGTERKRAACLMQLEFLSCFFFLISSKIYNNNKWNTHERKKKKKTKQVNDEVNQGHDKCKSFKAFFLSLSLPFLFFKCRCMLPPLLLYKNVFLSWYLTRQHHTDFLSISPFFCCYFRWWKLRGKQRQKKITIIIILK